MPRVARAKSPSKDSSANIPFHESDTALGGSAFLRSAAKPQVVSEAKNKFRKDDDVRWQRSGATWTIRLDCPEGERGGVHQFGVPPKGNANFAWVQHFIHHPAPQGMAGYVLANRSMSGDTYADVPGFCFSATTEQIASHGYVLTPSRYVGAQEVVDDAAPFEEKMPRLVAELQGQFAKSARLEAAIRSNLKGLGYE